MIAKYPSTQLLIHVERKPTPAIPEDADGAIVTYNTTITNIGGYMNISTGIFTVPIAGLYYFAWTGPNGEYIKRMNAAYLYLNGNQWNFGWAEGDVGNLKSHLTVQLHKGDKVALKAWFRLSYFPQQYEKFIGYFLG